MSPVPALSQAMIGIKPAFFFFFLEYLVGTSEAQRDILSFYELRKPKKIQIFPTSFEHTDFQ